MKIISNTTKTILVLLLTTFLGINNTNACMPFSPELLVVGEYNGKIEGNIPYERTAKGEFQFIDFKGVEKPFSKNYTKMGEHFFVDTDRINLDVYEKGDLLISISDYSNGNFDNYFDVLEVGKISCRNNDEFYIENIEGMIKSFGKKAWQCGNYKPDNVQSEKELLEKIKDKYINCEGINTNKKVYKRNADDELKLFNISKKISIILNKSKNKDLIIEKFIKKLSLISGKSVEELNSSHYLVTKFGTFKEYAIAYFYKDVKSKYLYKQEYEEARILENDFLRVFVTYSNIRIDNNGVYLTYGSGNEGSMLEFFNISKDEGVEKYINDNILEKKYIGKCAGVKVANKGIFTDNSIYGIKGYGEYKPEGRDVKDCGKYGEGYSIRYFEKREDYLIYVNAGQDYNGLDFSLIELK